MNHYNYDLYAQTVYRNNHYNIYPKNQLDYYNQVLRNQNARYQQNKNNGVYNVYNSNINNINININTINLANKNKKNSLQDEILSPNIEDNRPRPSNSNYYDDYNLYATKINYKLKYYNNEVKNKLNNNEFSQKNHLYDAYSLYRPRRRVFNIEEHKNINTNKKMLILDLDETLVHSCLKPIQNKDNIIQPDIYLKVKFHSKYHDVFVLKRPFVDEFLEQMNKLYNIIIFTASVQEYADPLLDQLDKKRVIKLRYYRNSCTLDKNGKFVKDLSTLYKDLSNVILLDNNPISYSFNKSNGLPIITWHFDKKDKELYKIIPVLEFLSGVKDVRNYIPRFCEYDMINYNKFSSLIDELNTENEQNEVLKKRPKSTKHFIVEKNDKKDISYNNENNMIKKNKNLNNYTNLKKETENKRYDEKNTDNNINEKKNENNHNYYSYSNINDKKYSTIDNTSSREYRNSNNFEKNEITKSLTKNNSSLKNIKKNIEHKHKKKEKHKKNKLTESYKKHNSKVKIKEGRNNSALNMKENKEITEKETKEEKLNQYLNKNNNNNNIFNEYNKKNENKNNVKKKDNYFLNKANAQTKNNNENNIISNYEQNTPFSKKMAEREENSNYKIFSGIKRAKNKNNNNEIVSIKKNIGGINLFQNDKTNVKKNDYKRIDIINYYKNFSDKKNLSMEGRKDNSNDLYLRKIKTQDQTNDAHYKNQSYQTSKKTQIKINNNSYDNTLMNAHNTALNFYSLHKNNNNNNPNERNNSNDYYINQNNQNNNLNNNNINNNNIYNNNNYNNKEVTNNDRNYYMVGVLFRI